MSDYTPITDFSAKDALSAGDPNKAVQGSQLDAEYVAIQTAVGTKYDSSDLASQSEAEAGTSNVKLMTPLRTAQWYAGLTTATRVKASDETVNNSTTLQDDDEIAAISLSASSVYMVSGLLRVAIKASSDIKLLLPVSSAPTDQFFRFTTVGASITTQYDTLASNSTASAIAVASDDEVLISIEGFIETNAAGTLKLQWAQNAGVAEDTIVRAYSFLKVTKIA